jgi:hypothetical protein
LRARCKTLVTEFRVEHHPHHHLRAFRQKQSGAWSFTMPMPCM